MKQNSESKFKMRVRVKDANVESMRSMPLHSSQCEVERTDKYADFEYFVAPTAELYGKLLSYGSGVEVLEPKETRLEMKNRTMNMSFIYSEEMLHSTIGKAVILASMAFPQADIRKIKHSLEMQRGIGYVYRLDVCLLYLEATCGRDHFMTFRLDDPDVLATFQRGDTEGVYMCSSEAVRAKLRETVIGSIDDIVEVNRNHHHPKTQPWPYDHSLVQTLISYFGVYVKCHHPKAYEIFMSGLYGY